MARMEAISIKQADGTRKTVIREMDPADVHVPTPKHTSATQARVALLEFGDGLTARITGNVLSVEPPTWKGKFAAAVAYKASAATTAQSAMIENEAAEVVGETPTSLCDKIIGKGPVWETEIGPKVTGLRRDIEQQIDAVTPVDLAADPFAYDKILGAAKVRAVQMAAAYGIAL